MARTVDMYINIYTIYLRLAQTVHGISIYCKYAVCLYIPYMRKNGLRKILIHRGVILQLLKS